ncbi:hypothetical protein B0A66_17925 [Flavobacterium hercynium]|uniref:Uncharacterized protein n=1 Tax=Flavobacterium hercynium TaxID=387094 RepID=A0A226GWB0_9FLAO|nr:hypothetical protein B0A66_17925 [Flavobacterium hercynium]
MYRSYGTLLTNLKYRGLKSAATKCFVPPELFLYAILQNEIGKYYPPSKNNLPRKHIVHITCCCISL